MLAGRTPSVDRRFFMATAQSLARLGFDVTQACAEHGLVNPLEGDGDRVPLAAVSRVYELASQVLNEPALAYRLVDSSSHEHTSVLFGLARCCKTPLEALRMICRFISIATDATRFDIQEDAQGVTLTVSSPPNVYVSVYQIEVGAWFMMQWAHLLRESTGIQLDIQVTFAHAALFDPQRYARLYGCTVAFEAGRNSLRLSGPQLRQAIPGHDERLQAYYQGLAERYESNTLVTGGLPQRVMLLFAQRMALGKPDAAEIATLLNMSRRTLQRHLQQAGTSWAQVTDQARQHVACTELRDPSRSLQDVAMLTGYEDTRAFLRAFRRWTGQTPSEYRAHQGSS